MKIKKTKKATKVSKKQAAQTKAQAATNVAPAVSSPVTPAVQSVRSEAARRTAAGKFNKVIFNQIGGKECPPLRADDVEGTRCVYGEAGEQGCAGSL